MCQKFLIKNYLFVNKNVHQYPPKTEVYAMQISMN